MKKRIQQVIDYKNITAGELAGMLGVQRSNISHILNGRNNPGASFIEKFLQIFPDIDARWLITGDGSMIPETKVIDKDKDFSEEQIPLSNHPAGSVPNVPFPVSPQEKSIEHIVLLYSDGTFTSYKSR